MALKKSQVREILSSAGVDSEHMSETVEKIMAGHLASVEALREENAELKESQKDYESLKTAKKELDELKAKVEADTKEREGKDYDKLKEEFDNYKKEQQAKETRSAKEKAYTEILKDAGIPEKHFAKILKYSDVDGVEFDEKGKVKGKSDILKSIREEWSDHIETTQTQGAVIQNPPENNGGNKMTIQDIYKRGEDGQFILNSAERQKAIAENMEQFKN